MNLAEERDTLQQDVQERLRQEISKLEKRLETAEQAVERAVVEKGILPELRSIINAHLPSYDTNLAVSTAPGLAEVFDPAYEISTESKEKLRRLLSKMPGGSIGVAGPRGVGKTTLLWSFCSKASTVELKGRPVLSVLTSAPVEYDAREFILHIFSSVCQRALELKGRQLRRPWDYMEEMQAPSATLLQKVMGLREALASILLGLLLTVSSYLLTAYLSSFSNLSTFFFGLGLFSIMLGLVVVLLAWGERRRRRMQFEKRWANERSQYEEPLVVEAYRWLREIRFQQSYSSGWAGSFKGSIAPIAVEARAEGAMSFAQNQSSLPEIIDGYRSFLELASEEYEVVIGIDELDKIGSDEMAQRFLNEIKALFGLENCFYLISVSESALSSFERRGLPLRDVFDSSFDAIVHVDYLNLDRAQRLLRRRVIGVPVPFLDFCHCISGGLPRDLIRVFRDLFEEYSLSNSDENNLSSLCGSLVRSDLKSKLRAVSVAAKAIMLEPEVNRLFERVRELELLLGSVDCFPRNCPDLLEGYSGLLADASQEPARQAGSAKVAAKREKIASLSTELGVYLYYSVTLMEFFDQRNFSLGTLKAAESSGVLDQLARARQFFAVSPSIAESTITDFRKSYGMYTPRGIPADPT